MIVFGFQKQSTLVYHEKTADEWFYGENDNPSSPQTVKEAEIAFNAMGPEVVPYLIRKFERADSIAAGVSYWLNSKMSEYNGIKLKRNHHFVQIQLECIWHLSNLPKEYLKKYSEELWDLGPQLKRIGYRSFDSRIRRYDHNRLGDNSLKTAFIKLQIQNPNFLVQLDSALLLSTIEPGATNGVPILIKAVLEKGCITSYNKSKQFEISKRREAHRALTRISPELAKQFPAP